MTDKLSSDLICQLTETIDVLLSLQDRLRDYGEHEEIGQTLTLMGIYLAHLNAKRDAAWTQQAVQDLMTAPIEPPVSVDVAPVVSFVLHDTDRPPTT